MQAGAQTGFAESRAYDVAYEGRRYAPLQVVDLAVRPILGRAPLPHTAGSGTGLVIKGGQGSAAFRALERCGFEIVAKGQLPKGVSHGRRVDDDQVVQLPPLEDVRAEVVAEGEHLYRQRRESERSEGVAAGSWGNGGTAPRRRSASAKATGDRAEAVVVGHLRATLPPDQAATVRWVAADGETPGWDVEYIGDGGQLEAVEVKGTVGETLSSVEVTRNEWASAERLGARYTLALVASCASSNPRIEFVRDPAGLERDRRLARTPSAFTVTFGREGPEAEDSR